GGDIRIDTLFDLPRSANFKVVAIRKLKSVIRASKNLRMGRWTLLGIARQRQSGTGCEHRDDSPRSPIHRGHPKPAATLKSEERHAETRGLCCAAESSDKHSGLLMPPEHLRPQIDVD